MDFRLSKAHGEETWSQKNEELYKELFSLMRIRDFISLLLTYPMKLHEEDIFKSWIREFYFEWKALLVSSGADSVMAKPWSVHTEKALECIKGFMPTEILSKVESGERSLFNHNDAVAIPEAILDLTVDLAVKQLIQTLFSGDCYAHYIRLSTRNLAEKRSVVNRVEAALEDKHNRFGVDKDFLRAIWINASTYETDTEVRVQKEINIMMKGASNRQLVIVVDADNKKLDLEKVHFPSGIVVLITTTQANMDDDKRITYTVDLNISTQDHLLSWELFHSHVDCSSSQVIQRIAVQIVKESHGHLFVLVLVANYLKNVQDVKQWQIALDKLRNQNPSYNYHNSDQMGINRVMVNAFVNIIWEDMDDIQKLCLELILFVENIKVGVHDAILVSDWAKIFYETQGMKLYVNRTAQYYIKELLNHFILLKQESGDVYLPVETYDIIKSLHIINPSIIKHGALQLMEPPYIGQWQGLIYIDLMDNNICELPQLPLCPKLKVLLLQGNVDLIYIPDSFFDHMPLLQYLDLSYTSIRDLPPSVSKLTQLKRFYLRGCDLFMELPAQMGQLKNLEELDLDGTLITHLPIDMGKLINLQSLTLCFDVYHHGTKGKQLSNSTIIPPGMISNLTRLNYLSINVDPDDERWNENIYTVLVEIFGLKRLRRVSMYVPQAEFLELIPAQISLNFRLIVGRHVRRFISRVTPQLEQVFKYCDNSIKFVNGVNIPDGVKMNLRRFKALYLDRHMTIKSLSDFEFENLQMLQLCILAECNEMETIVDEKQLVPYALPELKSLVVFYMKNLRSICGRSNPSFLFLKSIALHTCPMLTTIFNLDSLKNLLYLEKIIVEDCPKVTTLISHDSPEQKPMFFLPKLRIISLLYLPQLVNIFNGLHVEQVLEKIVFYHCPKLQSLSKAELSSKFLMIIEGEIMWWEALKWNAAEWGDAGRPNFLELIFSPINEEVDIMTQLAAHQETQLNTDHNDYLGKEMDRIHEEVVDNESRCSSSSFIALAIKGNRKSKYVVQWALNKFAPEGMIVFKLIHVRAHIKGVPMPFGNVIPLSQVHSDVLTAYRKEVERQTNQMLLPFKRMCQQRKVHVDVVVVESDDVATAVAEEVAKGAITKLVVGASSGVKFKRFSRQKDMYTKISECTPGFCTIYAASMGKMSTRLSEIIDGSFIDDASKSWMSDQYSSKDVSLATILPSPNSQENFNLELEKLRIKQRYAQELHAVTQSEKIEASRKLSDLSKRRLEETMKMKNTFGNKVDMAIKSMAKLEREKYQDESREAAYLKISAEREAAERKETVLKAICAAKEKEKLGYALSDSMMPYRKFTWDEIVSATSSFSEALIIGVGGYGTVYKCNLYHTTVVVKVLSTNINHKSKKFQQELEILSRIRHPNLLLLLGACPDRGCLVYEYMENGNLEERLLRKNNTSPIPWFERFRIAWEVASALAFLHSSKPEPIIHRDLKPANILLGKNFVSKIGDIGLATMLHSDNVSTKYKDTAPVGTLCYIDPEYQRTGLISPKSDVYAFGMVILQLLTAKPAIALAHKVETAIEGENLTDILDPEAGAWPIQETLDLALLGLSCTELRRKNRPDLNDHVLPTLERLKQVAHGAQHPASISTTKSKPPNHFICPILQEVMDDPCVAADGFTYDRKAIEHWLEMSDTSPMTNVALPHKLLVPNITLLSAILEWKSRES